MDREDSSNYTQQPAVETPSEAPQVVERKKKSRLTPVLVTLFFLALIAAGAMGWLWQQEASKNVSAKSDVAVQKQKVLDLQDQLKKAQSKVDEAQSANQTDQDQTIVQSASMFVSAFQATVGKSV